jgi:cytochrome c oxidase subunit 1
MLFALAVIANFAIGGTTGIFLADVATDIQLQDTYFVVAHFHYTIMGGEIFAIFAGIYYWFPKITGKMYNETLGKVHAVLMFVMFNLTFFVMFYPGTLGMSRRVATYPDNLSDINGVVSILAVLLGLTFLVFLWNLVVSLTKGERASSNPWGSNTLEWQTSSPPPIENFEEIPRIVGTPYGFGNSDELHVAATSTGKASGKRTK